MEKSYISYKDFERDVKKLASLLIIRTSSTEGFPYPLEFYGIPRGGVNVALELTKHLKGTLVEKDKITPHTIIIDDLIDSGATLDPYKGHVRGVLYRKSTSPYSLDGNLFVVKTIDGWIEFFYEETEKDIEDYKRRIRQYEGK